MVYLSSDNDICQFFDEKNLCIETSSCAWCIQTNSCIVGMNCSTNPPICSSGVVVSPHCFPEGDSTLYHLLIAFLIFNNICWLTLSYFIFVKSFYKWDIIPRLFCLSAVNIAVVVIEIHFRHDLVTVSITLFSVFIGLLLLTILLHYYRKKRYIPIEIE